MFVAFVAIGITTVWLIGYASNPHLPPLDLLATAALLGVPLGGAMWLVAAWSGGPNRDERARIEAGLRAEHRVAKTLRRLPDGYVVVNSLALPRGGDVDHLVVGPTGIFVLETKAYTGEMVCEDGTWRRTKYGRRGGSYEGYIADPTTQTERLVGRINGLLRAGGCGHLRATGCIVFASDDATFDDTGSRVPAFSARELMQAIQIYPTGTHLRYEDVQQAVDAILAGVEERSGPQPRRRQTAQAVVEVAVALPVVLLLSMGVLGGYRIASAAMGVGAVAREAARAAAVAPDGGTASSRGVAHGQDTATEFGLRDVQVRVDVSDFGPGGTVRASAAYTVDLGDLPLVGWVRLPVQRRHAEPVDLYRSFSSAGGGR